MKKRFFMLLVLAVVTLLAMCSTAMAADPITILIQGEVVSLATQEGEEAVLYCDHEDCKGQQILLDRREVGGVCRFAHNIERDGQTYIHLATFSHKKEWNCNDFCEYCGRSILTYKNFSGVKIKHAYDSIGDWTDPARCNARAKVYDRCANGCGNSVFLYEEGDINPNAHKFYSWNYVVDGAPTCTTPGTKTATCSWCKTATDTIADPDRPALNHIPGAAADCTSDQTCARCGEVLKYASGHNYKGMTNKEYTNLGANHDVDGICPNCGCEIGHREAHIYYLHVDGVKKCACGAIDPDYVAPIPDGLNPEDGWVYENGEKSDFTGLYPYNGGLFYILNGQWQRGANGLTLIIDEFWFLANGQVQEHHGFAEYDGEWFYLDGGKLDTTASGVYGYDGKTFLVAAGRLVSEYTGLAQVPSGEWYYVAEGRVLTEFSGEIEWNGGMFQIVNGKLVA